MPDTFTINRFIDGNAVFLNYYITGEPFASYIKYHYEMTLLPGRNEELSTSSISGFNIGINRLLETIESESENVTNAEKLEAAIKVTKIISSKNFQKMLFIKGVIISAIPSLFDDEEVCEINDCELFKKMQPITERIYELNEKIYSRYDYELRFRKIAANYLFNKNVDLEDTLRKIEDITKIYYVPLDFSLGFTTVIIIFAIAFLMFISLIFLFFENYQPFFKFFSDDSWFILIFGITIILCSGLMDIGELTISKCHLKICLLEFGMTIYLSINLYELMVNLPLDIIINKWMKKNKYLFLLILYLFDIILTGLTFLDPYNIENVIVEDGQNYQICKMKYTLKKIIIIIMSVEKVIFFLGISFIIFIEWNMKKIRYEIRFLLFSLYSNLLLLFVLLIINFININNYYLKFILQQCILIFISILSYACTYGYKIILAIIKKKNLRKSFINKINKSFMISTDLKTHRTIEESYTIHKTEKLNEESAAKFITTNNITYDSNKNNQQKDTLYSKIILYHYSSFSSIENDNGNDESNTFN